MKTTPPLTRLIFLLAASCLALAARADPQIRIEALFPGRAVVNIDGQRRVLEAGKPGRDGVTLLSADSRRARLQIGDEVRELGVNERVGASFSAPSRPPGLTLVESPDGHFYVDGAINGNPVRMVVDTGASSVALSAREARRLGILFHVDGTPMTVETASGPAKAFAVRLRELRLRSIVLTDVRAMILEGDFPRVALLGQSGLERLQMTRNGALLELRQR